jgi:hypothetical protein
MPFPEFTTGRKKVLFFSRGRGRGHARPDVEIVRTLAAARPDVEAHLVSYGTGAETIMEAGLPVIDIDMPDGGPTAEISVAAGRLIRWLDPDLVVSHEEFAAAPAAAVFEKPCVFITDFFTDPEMYSMHALQFADEILFVGRPGKFEEPDWVRGKVRYLGPLAPPSSYGPGSRCRAREELGLDSTAFILGVFPGSWTEYASEFSTAVLTAFDAIEISPKGLVWIAGPTLEDVAARTAGRASCLVFRSYPEMSQAMSACDVGITRANRVSTFELVNCGVPVIAITWGLNPADDRAIDDAPGVTLVRGEELAGGRLAKIIRNAEPPGSGIVFGTFADCAAAIARRLPPG